MMNFTQLLKFRQTIEKLDCEATLVPELVKEFAAIYTEQVNLWKKQHASKFGKHDRAALCLITESK
jgi:hypothetical protein